MPTADPPARTASAETGPGSVVVVGAGLAGAQTVAALRAHGFEGRITLLGREGIPPYDRPPLSKELLSRPVTAWLTDELGVDVAALADEVRLADPAVRLETDGAVHLVTTRSGALLPADAVVLALGSEPVRPAGWDGAVVLHDAADAEALRGHVRPGTRLVVVGAGWIGAEVAGVAAGAGADVTVLEAASAPLLRQLGETVGTHLARWYDDAGVRLRTGTAVTTVDADGVTLADGEHVPADVVLTAVGARPATGWLAGAVPLDPRGGVPVDETGAVVGRPGLWAVGDCAVRTHPVHGDVPGGHWSAALHDPEPTVRALLGLTPDGAPGHAPYVFSQQLGHDLALFGVPGPDDELVFRSDPDGGPTGHDGWAAFYLVPEGAARRTGPTAGRVATARAVLLVDSPRDVGPVRKAMNRGTPLRVDLDTALDPARKLRDALL